MNMLGQFLSLLYQGYMNKNQQCNNGIISLGSHAYSPWFTSCLRKCSLVQRLFQRSNIYSYHDKDIWALLIFALNESGVAVFAAI